MKNQHQVLVALTGCVLWISAGSLAADDWPQWRGAQRDGKASGFTAPDKWPTALTPKWKVKVGAGDASPALVGDRVYVFTREGANEVTLCLNAADGKELWRDQYEAQAVEGAPARHPGPRSSPAVAEGKVVTLGVGGVVSCLNAADGKLVWRKDEFPKIVPRFYTAYSPIIVDGLAIAHVGGQGKGALIAFDLGTGEPKWKWSAEGPAYASPALMTVEGTKQVVTMAEKSVVGIAVADGKLLWEVPWAPTGMNYNAATPIIQDQTVIFTGAGRGTRAVKVTKQGDGFAAQELWKNPVATKFNSPILKDGFLFGLSDRGNLFCLNAETGKEAWLDQARRGQGGFGSIVDAGSVLFVLANDSELIAFKPSDKEYSELAKIKVAESETYAHPVLAGNQVLIKDKDSLAMLAF